MRLLEYLGMDAGFRFQTSGFQCAAYAIFNYLTLFHIDVSQQDVKTSQKNTKLVAEDLFTHCIALCNASPHIGTSIHNMNAALHSIHIKPGIYRQFQEMAQPTFTSVMQQLQEYGHILLLYHWQEKRFSGEHYALILLQKGSIVVVNHSYECPLRVITLRELKSLLWPFVTQKGDVLPHAWKLI